MESFFPLLKAMLQFTVPLTIISFILGILVAFGVAIIRVFHIKPLIPIVKFYVWLIRGTPLMVQLFILFYGLPSVGVTLNAFTSAIIGFTLNIGAYNSETIRAAIESIDKGQWEAAHALGLTRWQTLIRIIFPQAIKVAVPPVSNSFIGLVKDTSLAATLTVTELFHKAQQITARTYEPLWLYLEAAFFYLILCSVLAYYQGKLEQKYNKYGT
ncbi:MAG: cysteine ABC transporter permease [Firmicutes bacterium HGW-Firmicutes-7]|nr:MAG: cysteine ABC transporter permease [Firmicutes bacterium HGW-Firmicutes-7]